MQESVCSFVRGKQDGVKGFELVGGSAQWLAFALPQLAAPGSIPGIPDFFSVKNSMLLRL